MGMILNSFGSFGNTPLPDPSLIGGIDANTVLMLHMDGTDASTTFTDDSDTGHTVTANGNAQIDTAEKKFGAGAGLFDGTGDYLTVPTSTDFNLGTGDFCIDFWVYFNSSSPFTYPSYYPFIVGSRQDDNNRWHINFNGASGRGAQLDGIISGSTSSVYESTQPSQDAWHHYAMSRLSGTVRIYRDGVLTASGTVSGSLVADQTLNIAYRGTDTAEAYLDGSIDEVRISKGNARIDNVNDPLYCGGTPANGFTPPAYAYTDER